MRGRVNDCDVSAATSFAPADARHAGARHVARPTPATRSTYAILVGMPLSQTTTGHEIELRRPDRQTETSCGSCRLALPGAAGDWADDDDARTRRVPDRGPDAAADPAWQRGPLAGTARERRLAQLPDRAVDWTWNLSVIP